MHCRFLAVIAVAVATAVMPAFAAPTPVPGGANQTLAVAGTLHDTLFNGQARVRKMSLGKPNGTPSESYPDTADSKWIVFRAVMSNGTRKPLEMTQFTASIVDADGIAVAAQPDKVRPMGVVANIPPGGAWKETILFEVPTDFKPAKIVLVSANPKYKSFRITVAQ